MCGDFSVLITSVNGLGAWSNSSLVTNTYQQAMVKAHVIAAFPALNSNDSPYDEGRASSKSGGDDEAYVETAAIVQASEGRI